MKYINILVLYASITSCCHSRYHMVTLIPDNKWHTVYTLQIDTSCLFEVEKSSAGKDKAINYSSRTRTQVRLLRITPFQDITHLPDTLAADTDADSEVQRSSDFGPQDMSQDGSKRSILLTPGVQLLSRSNQPNAVLFIKKNK